jgi:hypothetical protein
MDSRARQYRKANPDAYPTPAVDDPDDPMFGPDAGDVGATPDVAANGRAAPDARAATDREAAGEPGGDPYDLESLRVSQDFVTLADVKPQTNTIHVRKPAKEWFVRVHPDRAYQLRVQLLELKEEREVYVVSERLRPELALEATVSERLLVTAINRQGQVFVWPLREPREGGRRDDWTRSAWEAAAEARSRWVRVVANMGLGAYEMTVSSSRIPEPNWPDLSLQEIVKVAFRDRVLTHRDHPVLRALRGES